MLRNCEADLRRELSKTQSNKQNEPDNVITNKKESHEVLVVPSSPVKVNDLPKINYSNGNGGRFSPRKTHLTNFINQNIAPGEMLRQSTPEPTNASAGGSIEFYESKMKRSPAVQFNTIRDRITPPRSPRPRRRFRSQSPRVCIEESDSDSDTLNANRVNAVAQKKSTPKRSNEINGNKENKLKHSWRKNRSSSSSSQAVKDDIINQNTVDANECNENDCTADTVDTTMDNRPFRSIDMAHRYTETYYCPQSEPLKRKIYSEKTLDRLQKSLDMESGKKRGKTNKKIQVLPLCALFFLLFSLFFSSPLCNFLPFFNFQITEIPRKALLQKITNLRRDRQQQQHQHQQSIRNSHSLDHTDNQLLNGSHNTSENDIAMFHKRQLILNTIEDLKRNLEDQSIELCGLNDDEE